MSKPAPPSGYSCPQCETIVAARRYMSRNTFYAKYYSDGRMDAPMYPDVSRITQCRSCETYFWLNETNEIEKGISYYGYEWAQELDEYDLYSLLQKGFMKSQEDQLYYRLHIWWTFNRRIRAKKDLFQQEEDQKIYEANLIALADLLDLSEATHVLMRADIYRYFEDFEQCLCTINLLEEKEYWYTKKQFKRHCKKGNRFVFQIEEYRSFLQQVLDKIEPWWLRLRGYQVTFHDD